MLDKQGQALDGALIPRKVNGGGNRTVWDAATQPIVSVLPTARQRGLDAAEVLADLVRTPRPTASAALFTRVTALTL